MPRQPLMPPPPVAWAVVLVGVVDQKVAVAIFNSFYVAFCPIDVHIPNFIQIGQKVKEIGFRLALVGWSGQSKNSRIHFKLNAC